MAAIAAQRLGELLGEWRRGGAAHDRLAATVRSLVLDGVLPVETRLPAERRLAAALGVSRATVAGAYGRLRAEGYLASRRGSGSWISLPAGHRSAPDRLAPAGGIDLRVAALTAPPALDEIARAAAADLPGWLDHHGYDPLGLPPLRAAIAARFAARGLPTRPEQILVTNGAQQALDLCLRALLRRGRPVLTELPSYPVALDAIRAAGGRLVGAPVTSAGWDMERLAAVAREHEPALAFLIPDFQNPTGALLDERGRRRALRALAQTYTLVDETFVELALDEAPLPCPAATFGGPRTITIGSLGKAVWGGLRIGWIRAEPALVQRLAAARATADMASPVLEQLLAVRVLASLDASVADRRRLLRPRRDALAAALAERLPEWSFALPRGGLFLWVELPEAQSTSLAVAAGERGVHVTAGPRFGAHGLFERYLRLPFTLPPAQLEQAVAVLAEVAREPRRRVADRPPAYVA